MTHKNTGHPSYAGRVAGGGALSAPACTLIIETLGMAAISLTLLHLPEIIHFIAHMEALQ